MRTITTTGMALSSKGYPKTGSCENNMLLNGDNGDDDDVYTE